MTHPLFDLSGRVALVSGAARGIGRAMSLGFAEVGADLVLADLDEDGARRTAAAGVSRSALLSTWSRHGS